MVTAKSAATGVPLAANLVEREKEMIETALREAEGVVAGPTQAPQPSWECPGRRSNQRSENCGSTDTVSRPPNFPLLDC